MENVSPPTVPLVCVVIADLTVRPQLAENDMLVDDYEQYPNEKTDVVVVSRSGSDEPEPAPSAADRRFLCFVSPPLPPQNPITTSMAWPTSGTGSHEFRPIRSLTAWGYY